MRTFAKRSRQICRAQRKRLHESLAFVALRPPCVGHALAMFDKLASATPQSPASAVVRVLPLQTEEQWQAYPNAEPYMQMVMALDRCALRTDLLAQRTMPLDPSVRTAAFILTGAVRDLEIVSTVLLILTTEGAVRVDDDLVGWALCAPSVGAFEMNRRASLMRHMLCHGAGITAGAMLPLVSSPWIWQAPRRCMMFEQRIGTLHRYRYRMPLPWAHEPAALAEEFLLMHGHHYADRSMPAQGEFIFNFSRLAKLALPFVEFSYLPDGRPPLRAHVPISRLGQALARFDRWRQRCPALRVAILPRPG